eukprot:3082213-Lingulodinium_polyedra.AAC.1
MNYAANYARAGVPAACKELVQLSRHGSSSPPTTGRTRPPGPSAAATTTAERVIDCATTACPPTVAGSLLHLPFSSDLPV